MRIRAMRQPQSDVIHRQSNFGADHEVHVEWLSFDMENTPNYRVGQSPLRLSSTSAIGCLTPSLVPC